MNQNKKKTINLHSQQTLASLIKIFNLNTEISQLLELLVFWWCCKRERGFKFIYEGLRKIATIFLLQAQKKWWCFFLDFVYNKTNYVCVCVFHSMVQNRQFMPMCLDSSKSIFRFLVSYLTPFFSATIACNSL